MRKVLPMSSVHCVTYLSGWTPGPFWTYGLQIILKTWGTLFHQMD